MIECRGEPVARLVAVRCAAAECAHAGEGDIVAWLDAHPLPSRGCRSPEAVAAGLAEERAAWS